MVLVGFHIAQKNKEFPQWIWHVRAVDHVPPRSPPQRPDVVHNGTPASTGTRARQRRLRPVQLPPTSTPTQVRRVTRSDSAAGRSRGRRQQRLHAACVDFALAVYHRGHAVADEPCAQPPAKPRRIQGFRPVPSRAVTDVETYFHTQPLAAAPSATVPVVPSRRYRTARLQLGFARRPHPDPPPPSNVQIKATSRVE